MVRNMRCFFLVALAVTSIHSAPNNYEDRERAVGVVNLGETVAKLRTINGVSNNIANPLYGAAKVSFTRLLPAEYGDGVSSPRVSRVAGATLPNARHVSATIHTALDLPDSVATNMLVMFGQYIDHDITETPQQQVSNCCGENKDDSGCFAIDNISNDPFYSLISSTAPRTCIEFHRSHQEMHDGVAEQENEITAFIDASNVYQSLPDRAMALRNTGANRGLLTSTMSTGGYELLPLLNSITDSMPCSAEPLENIEQQCLFIAGDIRARENPVLTSFHTLFMREHNRVANRLADLDPSLDDETIYQQARRIVIAQYQNIVFGEYLPIVLGSEAMQTYGLDISNTGNGYNEETNPGITSAFATAAYRFGHSMVQGTFQTINSNNEISEFLLRDNYFKTTRYVGTSGEGMEDIFRGLLNQPMQKFDRFMTEDLTQFLFGDENSCGTVPLNTRSDLAARNIQRGRDHGIPGYLDFREALVTPDRPTVNSPPPEISEADWNTLNGLYASPDDIDLFTAGLLEIPAAGALTGATFNAIKALQFQALREGDRFFFTHPTSFTSAQLVNLRRRSLRDIICDNTQISQVRPLAFRQDSAPADCMEKEALVMPMFVGGIKKCGENAFADATLGGEFQSPNYPGNYDNHIDCSIDIQRPPGSSGIITLTFLDFQIEDHPNCVWDYVEIHAAAKSGSDMDAQLIGRYCGNSPPAEINLPADSVNVRISFHTDHSVKRNGFRLAYGMLSP